MIKYLYSSWPAVSRISNKHVSPSITTCFLYESSAITNHQNIVYPLVFRYQQHVIKLLTYCRVILINKAIIQKKICQSILASDFKYNTYWFCISWIVNALFPTPPAIYQISNEVRLCTYIFYKWRKHYHQRRQVCTRSYLLHKSSDKQEKSK